MTSKVEIVEEHTEVERVCLRLAAAVGQADAVQDALATFARLDTLADRL